jgi:hypothetical protein
MAAGEVSSASQLTGRINMKTRLGRWALGMGAAAAMSAALVAPIASSASAATTQPSQAVTIGPLGFPPTGTFFYSQAQADCLQWATPWNQLVRAGLETSVAHCTTLYSLPTSPTGGWVSYLTIGFFLSGASSFNTVTPPY